MVVASDQQGKSGLDGGGDKQALLENDAQPLSYTSGAAQCKAVVVLGSSQGGVSVCPSLLSATARQSCRS